MAMPMEQSVTELTVIEQGDNKTFKGDLCSPFTVRRKIRPERWRFVRSTKPHGYVRREISLLKQR